MRNFHTVFLLLSVLFRSAYSSAENKILKGCHFGLSYSVINFTLTMTSGFYGDCYGEQQASTQVVFGNGDQLSWITPEMPSTYTYVYPLAGAYTAEVWVNGQNSFDFNVEIIDPNAPNPCDSEFFCAPSFTWQLFYSEAKQNFILQAQRTDDCSLGEQYWKIGAVQYMSDTLNWFFPKAEEGNTTEICLHIFMTCSDSSIGDTSSCEEILISKQDATLIDPVTGGVPQFLAFPTDFENEIHIAANNFVSDIQLSIYALDGREIFCKKLSPQFSSFTINTNNFLQGIYLVNARSTDFNSVSKMVKE